jgi:hypothetical protein
MKIPRLTAPQRETCRNADRIIRNIDALAEFEPFRAFMARFQAESDDLAEKILHGEMPSDEREKLRLRRLGILEVLKAPTRDRADAVMVLKNHGIKPGETDEDLKDE